MTKIEELRKLANAAGIDFDRLGIDEAFVKEQHDKFNMLSDQDHAAISAIIEVTNGTEARGAFVHLFSSLLVENKKLREDIDKLVRLFEG